MQALEPVLPDDWPFSESWSAPRLFKSQQLIRESRRHGAEFGLILRERWAAQAAHTLREESTMGRLIQTIPANAPVSVEVPEEVAKELNELWAYMVQHPEFMAQATFTKGEKDDEPDADAAKVFLTQAKAWAAEHTDADGKPEPLEVRKSPSRTLPDHVIRFNIRHPLTPEEVAANAEKNRKAAEAREAKKKAAGKPAK